MLIRSLLVLCLALPPAAASAAPKKTPKTTKASKAKAKRASVAKKAKTKRPRRRHVRRRVRGARCRDIFCTAQIVRMDGRGEKKGLNEQQVEKVAATAQKPLEPCLVHARRRDPSAVKARVEMVVDRRGRILASRVNGKRWSPLARCVHRKLRTVRFPKTDVRRQVAAFTIAIPN
jgi:hypothetical protein